MTDPRSPRKTTRATDRRRALLASTSLVAALAAASAAAQTVLPTHGTVASGAASINQSGAALTINQTSSRAVINWNSFSIGAGDNVTFVQPNAGSATLNRVTGSTTSSIAGSLDANGQVYIVNPNGVAITRSGTVNVGGGFVASTLGISNSDFNKGNLSFSGGGASAPVSNAGTITAAPGGFVGLLGGSVSNSGMIAAPVGKVGLGSGEQATLDLSGDGFLQVALPTNATTADGKALVDVTGTVKAAGGVVAIKAATAANAVRNAINLSGYVSARSARAVGGSIVLGGGDGGDVKVSGKLDASGPKGGGSVAVVGRNVTLSNAKLAARSAAAKGGRVAVSAKNAVKLIATEVDASGATGGGKIAIGGDTRGLGPLVDAATTTVGAGSVLRANAVTSGDGGLITVWSNQNTTVAGDIYARGGAGSGNGGFVETSGETLSVGALHVDTRAAHGVTGTWLLDPVDFTIAPSGGDMTGAEISTDLATSQVVIQSSQGSTGTNGDIIVNDAISWSSANMLTLDAYRNINVNQNITIAGAGKIAFIYGDQAQNGVGSEALGGLAFAMSDSGPVASLLFTGAGATVTMNGAAYTFLHSETELVADLTANPGGDFALANNIALTQSYQNDVVADFYGKLDGLGYTISGLKVAQTGGANNVGFIGVLDADNNNVNVPQGDFGRVSNIFFSNVSVTGGTATGVGAVAGTNYGLVLSVGVSGAMTGSGADIGGVVGDNAGLVRAGLSSVVVNQNAPVGDVGDNVGGAVGLNSGGVDASTGSGIVQGDASVGGLVGQSSGYVNGGTSNIVVGNTDVGGVVGQNGAVTGATFDFRGQPVGQIGQISGAFMFGQATGTDTVGGVVGLNAGQVIFSFANGPVSGTNDVGGLVGINTGDVSTSYAIGAVQGGTDVGGLVGANSGTIEETFALGATIGTSDVGGLVGSEGVAGGRAASSITDSFSTGAVYASTAGAGGLIGVNLGGANDVITDAYWDTSTSGQATSAGGVGYATANLQGATTLAFATTEFAGGAAGGETNVYPYLTDFFPNGVRAFSGFAYKDAMGTTALVSGAAGIATVYEDFSTANGDRSGATNNPGTTGANGYYYIFQDAGRLATGADVVVYTPADPTTGATNGATYVVSSGVNNQTVSIFGQTFNETTALPTYSGLVAAVAGATNNDVNATNAIAGVSYINITATNAAGFTIDTPINTTADLTIASVTTALDANVTATGGILFDEPVTLGATVTVDSGAAGTEFAGAIDGSGAAGAGLTVNGPVSLFGDVTTANGALAFNGPVTIDANLAINSGTATTTFGSTIDSAHDGAFTVPYNLTATAGAFSFGGAIGGQYALSVLSFTSAASLTLPSITGATILADATAAGSSLTLPAGTVLTASGAGGVTVTLAAAGAFINDAGAAAINLTGVEERWWYIYSNNPTGDVFGGLNSNNQAIWNTTYPPATAPAAGDHYLFAFQPTVTFTSINDSKTYGQDATAKVATDYTVSGIDPGVAGAYLADTAANAYSGAPGVTSAGAAPTATVAGGPYAINVAQGSLAALSGYALALASPGVLTVNPEAITVAAAANTKTYDSTTSAATLPTVTAGTLYDQSTLSETYASPNAGTGLQLNPAIAFANPAAASNYTVTLTAAQTGVINPEAITVTASANAKTYDSTTTAAALPTVTTGTLYDPATLSETYASPNAGTGLLLTPAIAFTNAGSAGNYAVTLARTGTGVINPEAITVTASTNTKTYDSTTTAGALPTLTTGTLYDQATLSEAYASANAGTGLQLNPAIAFANAGAANNYAVTLAPAQTGVITPEAITVTASTNTKTYDSTTTAAALPTLTSGTLYDQATYSETYASPNAGGGLQLNPAIAFANAGAAGNYAVTLAPAQTGVINPEAITVTASTNTKTYDSTSAATALPTITTGTLYDQATLSEAYASPNAGNALQLNPAVAFANTVAAGNYAVTLAPTQTGVIDPEPITITATPFTKEFDGTTAADALPTLTNGTLYDPATLSETFASPNPSNGVALIPGIAFTRAGAAGNYDVTLVPTGTTPPNTGVILAGPLVSLINLSPSVFVNPNAGFSIPAADSSCGVELQLPDPATFSDPVAAINAISATTEQYIERCRDISQDDVADTLDRYADALQIIIEKLPPKLRQQLRHIPAIVHAAAIRARAAPTRVAAVRVLHQAIAQVHREIMLVRAEDPDAARVRNAVSAGVSGVLNSAALALTRAEGI